MVTNTVLLLPASDQLLKPARPLSLDCDDISTLLSHFHVASYICTVNRLLAVLVHEGLEYGEHWQMNLN